MRFRREERRVSNGNGRSFERDYRVKGGSGKDVNPRRESCFNSDVPFSASWRSDRRNRVPLNGVRRSRQKKGNLRGINERSNDFDRVQVYGNDFYGRRNSNDDRRYRR